MFKTINLTDQFKQLAFMLLSFLVFTACNDTKDEKDESKNDHKAKNETPEYFQLRPALEKSYGYSHAVKIGNDLKISGAVSMNDTGMIVAPGDMEQQMKNCYADLKKILDHYGYTYDDVYAENIFTTSMSGFLKVAGFRNTIYKKNFPTGNWLEVKGLAVEGQLVEIDMEARK